MLYKNRRTFYTDITEHFLRLTIRKNINEVQSAFDQGWHRKTTKWLDEGCTAEERKLITEFYTYNQSIDKCNDYIILNKLCGLLKSYAVAMELC